MSGDDAAAKRDFAKWKFDTIELLMVGLDHREFRVANYLLARMNRVTRLINPSQRRMGVILGMDESAVRRAIKKLVDDEVVLVSRDNRQKTNHYEFSAAKLSEFYDLKRDREYLARLLPEREVLSAHILPEQEETPPPDQEETPSPDREDVSAKQSQLSTEGNNEELGHDRSGYQPDDLGDELREDASGEVSPQGERAGGGVRARPHVLTDALLKSRLLQTEPAVSLDRLEKELQRKGAAA